MNNMIKLVLTSLLSVSVLAACSNDVSNTSSPDIYKQSGLNQAEITTYATVLSLKPITIRNNTETTNPLSTNEVDLRVLTAKGIEFKVKTDQGQILTFAQAGDINRYHLYQRVRLITGPQGTKVDNE